jgi:Tetratricopeptide repeat
VWGNVPQRNKNFTGRQEILARLRQDVSSTVTAVLPHALQGMGGVGKTAVAIEYAHRYRSEYELVWWIPADQPTLVRSSLAAMAGPLGLQSATAAGIETAAATVLDALRLGRPFSRWLLIFDNADQPEEINDIIPRGPGDVLITSRNHRWESVVDTVSVDVFSRSESTAFLGKRVPRGLNEAEAARLAEDLGDLPLALEQAGAVRAETGMSVDEYLRLLKGHVAAIMAEGKSPEYPLSMTAAWRLSVSALSQQVPEAMELLRCCAFFGPEPIPRDLFRRVARDTDTRVSDLLANPILLARAIRELGRFALVKIDGRAIIVHRLIQALLREELGPADRASYRHEVHLILTAGAPTSPDDNTMWPRYAELVAHVSSDVTDLAHCQDRTPRSLAIDVVRYLNRSGDQVSARAFAEPFIDQWIADSGPDDPDVLAMQRILGDALRELGLYARSNDLSANTLARARGTLGQDHPLTLVLTNSSAADLRARGDFAAAQELDEQSLTRHQTVLGPENPQTLRVMNNLAVDRGLNSSYRRARELHEQTFLLRSEARGGVSTSEVLISWNGLARAVRLCGYFAEARDVGEDAYDFGRAELGPENYLTLRTAKDLSIALRRSATAEEYALELSQTVFDLSTRLFPGRPDTLAAAISLVNVHRVIGKADEILELAESTVTRYADVYGPHHPYSYGCAANLALLRRITGHPADARRLDAAALDGLDARLTRDHDYSLTVALNLASDLAALGETTQARALTEDSLTRLRRLMGDDDALTLGCAVNLVTDLRAEGSDERADALLADTLGRYERTFGADYPDAIAAAEGRRLDFDFDPPPI